MTPACENGNIEIPCDKAVKLLGVTFDQDFTFDSRVRYICSRVSKQVNVLQCIENILDFNSRLGRYNALISSQFKYCPLIWHFCGKNLSDKLEKLQTRALRFVYQDLHSKTDDLLVLPRTGNHTDDSLGH